MKLNYRLSRETTKMLWRVYRQSNKYRVRTRAHCILLINSEYEILELTTILGVSRKTIYNWLNNWSDFKLVGLYDRSGRGRKEILNSEQKKQIKVWEKQFQNNSQKMIINKVRTEWGITLSKDTISRIQKNSK